MIKKIAYLFGAGATHAELMMLDPDIESKGHGLLISDLSKRVMFKASLDAGYLTGVEVVSGVGGSLNIELLISLIESSKIHDASNKTEVLKKLIEEDIKSALPPSRTRRFSLHKGLLELHRHNKTKLNEELIALISLNYDNVLDRAYEAILGRGINYCFSKRMDSLTPTMIPLLKLHGSFNWNNQQVLEKRRDIDIIPFGSTKSYLHAPYSFIWNRALDILTQCDSLRVIGCSLSANDVHLIDLLFKAQLERRQPFDLEIIALQATSNDIKLNYGFFRQIKTLSDLGIPSAGVVGLPNPFKTWLEYKASRILSQKQIKAMPHLRRVMV